MGNVQKIGFVGLGLMGSRMAATLARKGFHVAVWNRTEHKARALAAEVPGIDVASSPAALVEGADAVCTCVADPAALMQVAFGADGVLAATATRPLVWIDFSTVSAELTSRLEVACAQKGWQFVEAPVTGSKLGAQKGTLLIMAGGSDAALARARPVLEAVGEKTIHCGPVGHATQVKLGGNAIIALMLQGLSEAMLLAQKTGVDPRTVLEVVQASGYRSPYYDFKGQALLRRDFETHFAIDLMFKDLSLFLDSAAQHRVPTPCAAAVRETYNLARASGRGELDITATVGALEDACGTQIGATLLAHPTRSDG